MTDEEVKRIVLTSKKTLNPYIASKIYNNDSKYINVINFLKNRYNDSNSIKESLYRFVHNIEIRPKCPTCGKSLPFIGFFRSHCNTRCSSLDKDVQKKLSNTCLEKYGVKNYSQTKEYQEKSKQTCLEKYGVEYSWQSENNKIKSKQTCFKKYGNENYRNVEKNKQTCLKRYGTEFWCQNEDNKKKIRETTKLKYGVEIINQFMNEDLHNKYVNTCMNKYGLPYVNQFSTEELRNNYKKYCLEHYGVDHPFKQIDKLHNTWIVNYGVNHPMKCKYVREKAINTWISNYGVDHPMKYPLICNKAINKRIMNGTWSSSKPEEELYLYIKEKFPDVKRQYNKDKRYPWHCDFYIPKLDYFIEYQGTWLHGKHSFDVNSKEDNSILNIWKEKSKEHPMYSRAIIGWTISDVNKRNKAKENNLNFKEVWNLDEGKEFINNLYESTK